jgi:hypothetical protein
MTGSGAARARTGRTGAMPIRNTTLDSTACGSYASGVVRIRGNMSTASVVTGCASWLCPPALSNIRVLVVQPLTTRAPDNRV